jgi:hypothetical protein
VVVVRHVTEEGGLDVACMSNHVHSESKAIGREDGEKREINTAIIKTWGACSRVRHETNASKTFLTAAVNHLEDLKLAYDASHPCAYHSQHNSVHFVM